MPAPAIRPVRGGGAMTITPALREALRYALLFDAASYGSTTLFNSSRYGLANTALTNGPTWQIDTVGICVQCVNTDSAYCLTGLKTDAWTQGTFAVYVKSTDIAGSPPVWGDAGAIDTDTIRLGIAADETYQFVLHDGTAYRTAASAVTASYGLWALLVSDFGPLGMRLFRDGVLIASDTDQGPLRAATNFQSLNLAGSTYGCNRFAFFGAWAAQMGETVSGELLRTRRAA